MRSIFTRALDILAQTGFAQDSQTSETPDQAGLYPEAEDGPSDRKIEQVAKRTAVAFARLDFGMWASESLESDDDEASIYDTQNVARRFSECLRAASDPESRINALEQFRHDLTAGKESSTGVSTPVMAVEFSDAQIDSDVLLQKWPGDYLGKLFCALLRHLNCCQGTHIARLKLTRFTDQMDDRQRVFFDLFLSAGFDHRQPSLWLESRCTFQSAIGPAEEPGCKMFASYIRNRLILGLVLKDCPDGGVQLDPGRAQSSKATPTVAIGKLLDEKKYCNSHKDCQSFWPRDRAVLCLKLAMSLLYLCRKEWKWIKWDVDSIFLLKDSSREIVVDKELPYLSMRLSTTQSNREELDDLPHDPGLLDFAQLLLEIYLGYRILDSNSSLKQQDEVSQLINNRSIFAPWDRPFLHAIQACMSSDGKEAVKTQATAQGFIFKNIVCNLEAYLRGFGEPCPWDPTDMDHSKRQHEERRQCSETLSYDGKHSKDPTDESAAVAAGEFLKLLGKFNNAHIIGLEASNPLPQHLCHKIKIAVIDSGAAKNDPVIYGARRSNRIKDCQNFLSSDIHDWDDDFGHGTFVCRLLLEVAPEAEIFVAKVSRGRYIDSADLHLVAEAIKWAVHVLEVDIISMSLALSKENSEIEKEIKLALNPFHEKHDRKLIFAAAGNSGGNAPRKWPASRGGVIAIHATDGLGNGMNINPSRDDKGYNFATLGRDIKMKWWPNDERRGRMEDVFVSGTSYATPIAAGIAANVLEFARHKLNLTPKQRERLGSGACMKEIFKTMAEERGDYRYVQPWTRWRDDTEFCGLLQKILDDH